MNLKKIVRGEYTGKDGKKYPNTQYRLYVTETTYIVIRPAFIDDYSKLNLIAEEIK